MAKLLKYPDGSVREVETKKAKKAKDITKSNLGN